MAGKIPPTLSAMPWNIKECIVANTDFRTKCCLRKVSTDLRYIAKTSPHHFKSVEIKPFSHVAVLMTVEDAFGECDMEYFDIDETVTKAAADFCLMFQHPNTTVERFVYSKGTLGQIREIYGPEEEEDEEWERDVMDARAAFLQAVNQGISQFNHKLNADEVELGSYLDEETILSWLPHFKPNYLKLITISIDDDNALPQVMQLDQWQQARGLKVLNVCEILELDMGDAYLVNATGPHMDMLDIYTLINNLLQEPTDHLKIVTINDATYERNHLLEALSHFDLILTRNEIFIEMPDLPGFLQISSDDVTELVLAVHTELENELWPIMEDDGLENGELIGEEDAENGLDDGEQVEEPEHDDE